MDTSKPDPPRSPNDNSYPSALYTAPSTYASSVISSQITDVSVEHGNTHQTEETAAERHSAVATPTSSFSSEVNRLPSATPSQTRARTVFSSSRRGPPFQAMASNRKPRGTFGGSGVTMSNTSRSQSATSRTSRTHVPSLASQAFFRPMSSQRLQAQRSGRPPPVGESVAGTDASSEVGSYRNSNSLGSNMATYQVPVMRHGQDVLPPSRGTDFAEHDDHGTTDASPTANATIRSLDESERPLQDQHLEELNKEGKGVLTLENSPRSFRANFLVPFNGDSFSRNEPPLQEPLSSVDSSPRYSRTEISSSKKQKTRFNYEYFAGNTVFWCGGRLQNTRDRPVNVMTGILLILPSILFFIYS